MSELALSLLCEKEREVEVSLYRHEEEWKIATKAFTYFLNKLMNFI